MSSNQTNSEKRKVISIVRRLVLRSCRKSIWRCLLSDLFVCALMIVLCLTVTELSHNNGVFFKEARRKLTAELKEFKNGDGTETAQHVRELLSDPEKLNRTIRFVVNDREGITLLEEPVGMYIIYPSAFFAVLFFIQLIFCLVGMIGESRRIRSILSPLENIAKRADELSQVEFDESKYLSLEEKIDSLATEDSLKVTSGDKDLERIETAINRLLMRMRESNMRQARFVNDASHELRTPIAVIEGYSNMLARWGREDEKVLDEAIQAIQHESSHMKYLVEQLLFLARGDSGKTVLHLDNTDLAAMMREIYEESLMIDEKHIYRFNDNSEHIAAECDPALMKQAVRILVDNAAKYTKEGDDIILSIGQENGKAYVQVQDTGIGMEQADVVHMFERFYRAEKARSMQGTGLGLSIAKWIVDKHGGFFEVTSRQGLGTRIRIVLGEAKKVNVPVSLEKPGQDTN